MSRTAQRHQAVWAKVQAKALAKAATITLVEGRKVISHHTNYHLGNLALCAALDTFYANPDGTEKNIGVAHAFDLVPLSTVPEVGTDYDPLHKVWMP